MEIEFVIILKDFAIDIKFQNELYYLLNRHTNTNEKEFNFNAITENNLPIYRIVSNTQYLNNIFINHFEAIINTKDSQTQEWLKRSIAVKYKLASSKVEGREGTWDDFRHYVSNI